MQKFAFISRHVPTAEQIALAAERRIELVHVGDRDAFTVEASEFARRWNEADGKYEGEFSGVVVVHPAAALRLLTVNTAVGVFENGNRAAEGEKPQFFAKALHIYSPIGNYLVDLPSHTPLIFEEGCRVY